MGWVGNKGVDINWDISPVGPVTVLSHRGEFNKVKIYLFIFILPAFLDTDLPRGNVHEWESGPMQGVIPTQSHNL